jgi:hypothetical protein
MTARSLLAAAFGVLGVYWIAYFGYAILAAVIGRDPRMLELVDQVGWANFIGPWLPYLALGLVFIQGRRRLASLLVAEDTPATALPDADVLRRLGIRLLAVSFLAEGARGLGFLAVGLIQWGQSTATVAAALVGVLLWIATPRLDAWIQREQVRALRGSLVR